MELKRITVPFQDVKAADDGSTFSGYCAAFHNCDAYGDVITPGAFTAGLADFLANGQILYDHDELIGMPLESHEDPKGLFVKGSISETSRGRDVKVLLKDKVLRRMSIGYRALKRNPTNMDDVKAYWDKAGYKPTPEDLFNLEDNKNYLAFLPAIKLYEASPVKFAANTSAVITDVPKGLLRLSGIKSLTRQLLEEQKAGRSISKANRERLKAIHDGIAPACKDLKDLLDTTDPDAGDDDDDESDDDMKAAAAERAKAASAAALIKARDDLELLFCDPILFAY